MKVMKSLNFDQSLRISVNVNRRVKMIEISEILYCQAARNYTILHLVNGTKYMVTIPLADVLAMLQEYGFYQIHKSYLVNLKRISSYSREEKSRIVMANKEELSVARREKPELLKILTE